MEEKNYSKGIFYLLLGAIFTAFLILMKFTASIMLPVVISIFLSLVTLPVIQKLNKKFHVPWGIGILLTLVVSIILIIMIGTILTTSIKAVISAYPKYEERFLSIYKIFAGNFDLSYNEGMTLFENLWSQLNFKHMIQSAAFTASNKAVTFLKSFVVVYLLLTFFLLEANTFEDKLLHAFEGKIQKRMKIIILKIMVETTSFISMKFIISVATGVTVYLGLLATGIDFPVVWAFFAFLMNFIPTFGSAISCISTILFSIIQFFPEWDGVLSTSIVMIATNFILGSVIEPNIQGKNLNLSPFLILVGLSLWGYIWGFIGMILAVPLLVILKIVFENVEYLKPLAVMMGNGKFSKRKILDKKNNQQINKDSSEKKD